MSALAVRINLLPEALRVVQVARRRRRHWLAMLAVAAVTVGGVWLWSRTRTVELERLRATLLAEQAHIRQEQKHGAMLAARMEVLDRRQAALDAMRATESWSTHLGELAVTVPDQVVLRSIQILPVETRAAAESSTHNESTTRVGTAVQIEGYAADHRVLAAFLSGLQEANLFHEISLVRSAAAPGSASGCLGFGIACRR